MKTRFPLIACLLLLPQSAGWSDDWPQYRGPHRSGVSREKVLLTSWPETGPKLLWTFRNAGLGFSPPSVVGQRLYTMGTRGKVDFLYAIDTATGEEHAARKFQVAIPVHGVMNRFFVVDQFPVDPHGGRIVRGNTELEALSRREPRALELVAGPEFRFNH